MQRIRAELDDRDDTLASRARDAQQSRVPYLAVVGDREAAGSHNGIGVSNDPVAASAAPGAARV